MPVLKRNAPCSCGSGKKFKHCCGTIASAAAPDLPSLSDSGLPPELVAAVEKTYTDFQRRKNWPLRYGAIPPSATLQRSDGMRLVSAGNKIFQIPMAESWFGFLYNLLAEEIGPDWFADELQKPKGTRHLLAEWYEIICDREANEHGHFTRHDPNREIGTTMGFRSIAYDLFCLMQAMNLSPKLIARLRHPEQFEGARYELWVAATLARAGFSIEFFDEDDRTSKHGEGIATHTASGKKFWVEAKRRHRIGFDYLQALLDRLPIKTDAKLVAAAMKKPADDDRLIFIDVNRPPWEGAPGAAPWINAFRKSLNLLERQPAYRGDTNQQAFVMVTNHPYHYLSNARPDPQQQFFGTMFNMPELNPATLDVDHPAIFELMQSINQHFAIPETFLEGP